jgi:5'-deoxynucleotidase YfbR-like HD superfamily hydrolase
MSPKEIVQEFLKLQKNYSFTKRKLVTAERYTTIAQAGLVSTKDFQNDILRESLVEHVGHLPILASFLYPHIQNKKDVDLGRVLIMLSIHDIGETVTGEIFAYDKTADHDKNEYEAALKILHPDLRPYLEEYEAHETPDARYAKSIDILAPNIHEIDMPKVTVSHFSMLGGSLQKIIDNKRHSMEWDSVLLEIFDLLMKQYDAAEKGTELVFEAEAYDRV